MLGETVKLYIKEIGSQSPKNKEMADLISKYIGMLKQDISDMNKTIQKYEMDRLTKENGYGSVTE